MPVASIPAQDHGNDQEIAQAALVEIDIEPAGGRIEGGVQALPGKSDRAAEGIGRTQPAQIGGIGSGEEIRVQRDAGAEFAAPPRTSLSTEPWK